jgi:hypothetical protein
VTTRSITRRQVQRHDHQEGGDQLQFSRKHPSVMAEAHYPQKIKGTLHRPRPHDPTGTSAREPVSLARAGARRQEPLESLPGDAVAGRRNSRVEAGRDPRRNSRLHYFVSGGTRPRQRSGDGGPVNRGGDAYENTHILRTPRHSVAHARRVGGTVRSPADGEARPSRGNLLSFCVVDTGLSHPEYLTLSPAFWKPVSGI